MKLFTITKFTTISVSGMLCLPSSVDDSVLLCGDKRALEIEQKHVYAR